MNAVQSISRYYDAAQDLTDRLEAELGFLTAEAEAAHYEQRKAAHELMAALVESGGLVQEVDW